MDNDEFIDRIGHHYAFLIEKYGFKIAFFDPILVRSDYAVVGLESDLCRIVIDQEWGGVTTQIGPPCADFNQFSQTSGESLWFNLERIVDFVEQLPFKWPDPKQFEPFDEMLAYQARKLEPIASQIFEMFKNEEHIDQWRDKFNAYTKVQFHLKYGKDVSGT